jgi:hypothetical protein
MELAMPATIASGLTRAMSSRPTVMAIVDTTDPGEVLANNATLTMMALGDV